MSSPHTTKGHEGGIIYSVCTSVELVCLAGLHQLDHILEGCRLVKSVPKGFTDHGKMHGSYTHLHGLM
jgi:hypothetical protein